ncbi:MAG: NAD(+) synthase [Deltaproteobacteria bacterium]|nr:NAD(+) synthase [Deltaproteobacteria bacterium]
MPAFSEAVLDLDLDAEITRITGALRTGVRRFKKRGIVVGISGGIDSSVVGALAVAAVGKANVFGLLMPERDSSSETTPLGQSLIGHFGIDHAEEDLTSTLEALGCYDRRDDAIRQVIPNYGEGWKSKIVLPSVVDTEQLRFFSVVAETPDGETVQERLDLPGYLGVVAATNFKQRCRAMLEYYHADRLNYVVAGTPNLLEYDQGFFVKNGDGAADLKPIAHLYKTQVYRMAVALGLPADICNRPPTTDTYSLPQSQEEFYFSLPYDKMDLCLYARDHEVTAADAAPVVGIPADAVERVYKDIDSKRRVAVYLDSPPLGVADLTAGQTKGTERS